MGITPWVGDCLLPVWVVWRSVGPCPIGHVSHRLRHTGCVSAMPPKPRVVVIVVFDGVKLLDAAGPGEGFAGDQRFGGENHPHDSAGERPPVPPSNRAGVGGSG